MSIYVIKAGADNYFWPESRKRGIAALMLDKPYYEAWAANDPDAHLAVHIALAGKGRDPSSVKAESTRWFNYASKVSSSVDDIFFNIVGNDVWWARSRPLHASVAGGDPVIIPHIDPANGQEVVAVGVQTDGWRQYTKDGVKLQLATTHKRAWDFLKKQSALAPVADEDMKLYLMTLLEGGDLSTWHNRPDWKAKQGEDKGKYLAVQASLLENGLTQLMLSIEGTVAFANGQIIDKKVKDKQLVGCTPQEMKQHLKALWDQQDGKCALTGIEMHLPGQPDLDKDLMISPDRIDSSGHYSLENVQLVCRFANFWKLASDNARFKELLDLVVATKASQVSS
ncbi:hypothetical protein [Rhizobium sp. MHM7A]|uniref:hypothetical protein n=1 Tax=Rhizobium sp. MHM7A TaxID=2583233 RepID=UPI001106141E|nr:hypothetical protein [Rhizobium sp. MHM7A]TLX17184.1 hypothetical protein FFR93_07695 [Rhizobium sp. MHM7A]